MCDTLTSGERKIQSVRPPPIRLSHSFRPLEVAPSSSVTGSLTPRPQHSSSQRADEAVDDDELTRLETRTKEKKKNPKRRRNFATR